jgi:hypothetical protein
MNSERIKHIQLNTAYPESQSVKRALLQVWNECEQGMGYTKDDMINAFNEGQALNVRGQLMQGKDWIGKYQKLQP